MIEQITLFDERWYKVSESYLPSATWILQSFPKGQGYEQWLKSNGEAAEDIKLQAADRGSRVHEAIELLVNGNELRYQQSFFSRLEGREVALNDKEWQHLVSFAEFWEQTQPKLVVSERVVHSLKYGFAGTLDALLRIDGKLYIADWKTSSAIHETYLMQIAAYAVALKEMVGVSVDGCMIVRTGTKHKTKSHEVKTIEGSEIAEYFDQFMATKKIWGIQHGKSRPSEKKIPLTINLNVENVSEELYDSLVSQEVLKS